MHRRALTAALSSAAVALTGAVVGTGWSGAAQAAEPPPPLVLTAPAELTETSYDGWIYSDLGIRMKTQGEAFEIRANRASYDDPITAVWKRAAGDVPLPEGSMKTWQGLDGFATVKVFRVSDGRRVRRIEVPGCFNGDAQRISPDGPARNPYPWGCPWNPYTIGSVMGIEKGYSTGMFPEWGGAFRLKPGQYRMVSRISDQWREFFGIPLEDGKTTTALTVREGRENWRTTARVAAEGGDGTGLDAPATSEPASVEAGEVDLSYAPDLRSLPAWDISINEKGTAIRFAANVWNGGRGPLVVDGFRETTDEDHMTAYQYFFDAHGEQTGYQQVGELHWHAENHDHWHFDDFASYRLLNADMSHAVRSTKRSFCLANTDAIDYTVENADWRPENTDLSSACGGRSALSIREVLSNGSGDTYHQFRAGQAFRVGDLPDGEYWIEVKANPLGNLVEVDEGNNASLRKIEIGTNRRGVRWVRAEQVGIIDEWMFGGGFFRSLN